MAVAKEPDETARTVKTIDQIIGKNLAALRKGEAITLSDAAEVLAVLTHRPLSESSLSRWEGGYNQFTATDLYKWSQIYGVNVIALLQPPDDVTHVRVNDRNVPVDEYALDFFIDPRGTFTQRAQQFAERHNKGTRDIVDALNDIRDRLGEKGRLADLHASYKAFLRLTDIGVALYEATLNDPTPEKQIEYDDFILAVDGWGRKLDPWDLEQRLKPRYDHERLTNGVDQQDD